MFYESPDIFSYLYYMWFASYDENSKPYLLELNPITWLRVDKVVDARSLVLPLNLQTLLHSKIRMVNRKENFVHDKRVFLAMGMKLCHHKVT